MFSKPRVHDYHRKLIKDMQACNLAVDDGVCYGYAAMAMQAILLRDTPSFDRRMSVLFERPEEELVSQMHAAWAPLSTINSPHKKAKQEFYLDMSAFLSNVSIYQNLRSYLDLIDTIFLPIKQDIDKASRIILPKKLMDQGGLSNAGGFYGVYKQYEISQLLRSLYEELSLSGIDYPVAFIMVNSDHALCVGFDPSYDGWLFMEVHDGMTQVVNSENLARKINRAFSRNENIAMSVSAYTVGNHTKEVSKVLDQWRLGNVYRDFHAMSMRRIQSEDSRHAGLLYMTVVNNDIRRLTTLLKSSHVDINLMTHSGISALHLASIKGYTECIRLLLNYPGVNPNLPTPDNADTALHIALSQQHLEAMRVLLEHDKVDVNVCRKDGYTVLHLAAANGCVDFLKALLLSDKLDLNKKAVTGATALHLAVQGNHVDCVYALLAHTETHVNAINAKGATPLMIAAALNYIDAAKVILAHYPEAAFFSVDGMNAYDAAMY